MDLQNKVATVSLAAIAIGCAMERLSLGLIVPGLIVFACLAWSHNRRGVPNA